MQDVTLLMLRHNQNNRQNTSFGAFRLILPKLQTNCKSWPLRIVIQKLQTGSKLWRFGSYHPVVSPWRGSKFWRFGSYHPKFHRGEGASFDALGQSVKTCSLCQAGPSSYPRQRQTVHTFWRSLSYPPWNCRVSWQFGLPSHGVDGRDRVRNVGSGNTNRDTSSFSSGSTVRTNHTCSIAVWSHPLTLRWEASASHPPTSDKVWIDVAKTSPTISVCCWHRGEDSAATRTSGGVTVSNWHVEGRDDNNSDSLLSSRIYNAH